MNEVRVKSAGDLDLVGEWAEDLKGFKYDRRSIATPSNWSSLDVSTPRMPGAVIKCGADDA